MNAALIALFFAAVNGKVVDSVAGRPVPSAEVVLQSARDSYLAETANDGEFHIPDAAPGPYEVFVRREGFAAPRTPVRLTVDVEPAGVTLRMTPLAVISGRIADFDGDPIAGATVEALAYSYPNGRKELRAVRTARTNDRGDYRLFDLPPGRYRVRASNPSPAAGASTRMMTVRGAKVGQIYPARFFPAATDAASAVELQITAGAELRDIDVQLTQTTFHTVWVTVTGATANARMLAIGISNLEPTGPSMGSMFSGRIAGRPIELPGVSPGRHIVFASDNQAQLGAQQLVTMGDTDLNVTLNLAPLFTVSGTVQLRGEAKIPLDRVNLRLEADELWGDAASAAGADGRFTLVGIQPAGYTLRTKLPPGLYLESVRSGERVVAGPHLDFRRPVQPLTITLAGDGGTIEGTAPPGAQVALAPENGWIDQQRTATAASDGRFELRDIAPGAYRIYCFEDAEPGAAADPDFRKPYEKQSIAIEAKAGERQKVSLSPLKP